MIRRLAACLLSAAAAFAACLTASGQAYPSRPVRIIVAFPPGGGNDLIARFVAERLTAALGQQFVVENRPGAGGSIGFEAGLKAAPDGYTLTLISSSYTINPSLYELKYDPIADIAPIIQISRGPLVVVVHPSVPATNVRELIELAKGNSGRVSFGSAGNGTTAHLATELFANMTSIRMMHVPYKGTGPALMDTLAGQIQVFFATAPSALPHVRAGKLRALAVTTTARLSSEPGIPSVAESVPGYEVVLWHGLIGPKGLPRTVVARINAEVTRTLKAAETFERLQTDGVSPAGGTPEEFLATIKSEIEIWRKLVKQAAVKAG